MNIDLTGRRAMVCGSTRGMGRTTAKELASLGASVVLVARDEEALKATRDALPASHGQRHDYICSDFSKPEQLRKEINRHIQKNPPVHILVNNTGGPAPGAILEAKSSEFIAAFSQHLICNQILVQAVVPGMKSEGYGRIINIISISVKQPIKDLGVSNTTRGAVASWAKTLATELAPFGITVNNVLPGATNTARLRSLFEITAKREGMSADEVKNRWKEEIPAGRIAEPEEIAQAIAFLASPAASYINGVNLPVDGGRLQCL